MNVAWRTWMARLVRCLVELLACARVVREGAMAIVDGIFPIMKIRPAGVVVSPLCVCGLRTRAKVQVLSPGL